MQQNILIDSSHRVDTQNDNACQFYVQFRDPIKICKGSKVRLKYFNLPFLQAPINQDNCKFQVIRVQSNETANVDLSLENQIYDVYSLTTTVLADQIEHAFFQQIPWGGPGVGLNLNRTKLQFGYNGGSDLIFRFPNDSNLPFLLGLTTKKQDNDYLLKFTENISQKLKYNINLNTYQYLNVYIQQFHVQKLIMPWNNNLKNQITSSFIVPVNCERQQVILHYDDQGQEINIQNDLELSRIDITITENGHAITILDRLSMLLVIF